MTTNDVLNNASNHLKELPGHVFDVISLAKPKSEEHAANLAKIVSKLSPLIGNLIEFNIVEFLNANNDFKEHGKWKRQDPGFPDTIFDGNIKPIPGFEIKAWFPLATEITARFKDSQDHFKEDQTRVAIIAWLPEHLIFGRPKIIDIQICSGLSIAKARDDHYHNPPDYLVLEPEDTTDRTANLQQTNTNGYKFQGSEAEFKTAEKIVKAWGRDAHTYSTSVAYQKRMRILIEKFKYRLDTNFAKMDRIVHDGIESFKERVEATDFAGDTISNWNKVLSIEDNDKLNEYLKKHLQIAQKP